MGFNSLKFGCKYLVCIKDFINDGRNYLCDGDYIIFHETNTADIFGASSESAVNGEGDPIPSWVNDIPLNEGLLNEIICYNNRITFVKG